MPEGLTFASAFSKPKTSPVLGWKQYARYFYPAANQYRGFARVGGEADQLYNQYKDAYLAGSPQAMENANIYRDYTKNLFSNQPNQFQDYQQVGDYLYGKLDDFRNTSAASGMRDMNSQLAGLGIRPGSTGYDRLLNANRITNNLAPVFANTTNAIGRDYSSLARNGMNETLLRLGLANEDALGGYMDRVYERPLDVAGNRMGMINSFSDAYGNIADNFNKNIAGWKTEETNNISRFAQPLDDFVNGVAKMYTSMYGGGGDSSFGNKGIQQPMMNQSKPNPYLQQMNQTPYSAPANYPTVSPTGGYSAGMSYNNPYLGDIASTGGFTAGMSY